MLVLFYYRFLIFFFFFLSTVFLWFVSFLGKEIINKLDKEHKFFKTDQKELIPNDCFYSQMNNEFESCEIRQQDVVH